jgi:methyl-accepting chemotaxis protein
VQSATLPSAAEFRRGFLLISAALSGVGVLVVGIYFWALIQLPDAQWWGFAQIVALVFAVLFVGQDRIDRRTWQPIDAVLQQREAGEIDPDTLRAGFSSAVNLPGRVQRIGPLWWLVGGFFVSGGMLLRYETFPFFAGLMLFVGAVAGGFVTSIFMYYALKRQLAPIRDALAQEIGDPDIRAGLIERRSLRSKLLLGITGVMTCTVLFCVFAAHQRSMKPVEAHVARIHARYLEEAAARFEWEGKAGLDVALRDALRLGVADALVVFDSDTLEVLQGESALLHRDELMLILESGVEAGDSTEVDMPHVLTWRVLSDGIQVIVAVSNRDAMWREVQSNLIIFGVLVVGSAGLAILLAVLLSADVSDSTERLRREAERLASGDLRPGAACEGEDELGDLSRSFESMTLALRGTVIRVASAADRVEVTAGEMAEAAQTMSSVTADQVSGIRQTSSSMEAIDQQVQGIARSSQALSVSVEESSSSVLELGASGEELNQTARGLSEQVNEVSSSIEQMVRSVKQVLENTESLAEAAVETSASMGEMATSMRAVDTAAEETARLSQQVVESAETGQAKMVQTIRGMDAIREATETAERVIRGLGTRATEIGAIVDVIDDVADETNLLALNAAIIAAQAGEQGRAFSVVADEIKDLADRVLVSTKEIGAQIRAVQEESANAIGAIERGTESVAGGVDLTAEAGESLEEITRASRESGTRIAGIVSAVREQARAASHVVDLMERVRVGVEEIKAAAQEQDRGNEVVWRGSVAMRDAATQVRSTTEEQARGSGRIGEGVETVREALEQINESLQEQSASCRSAVEFLEAMHGRTRTGEETAQKFGGVAKDLLENAESLREDVARFQI